MHIQIEPNDYTLLLRRLSIGELVEVDHWIMDIPAVIWMARPRFCILLLGDCHVVFKRVDSHFKIAGTFDVQLAATVTWYDDFAHRDFAPLTPAASGRGLPSLWFMRSSTRRATTKSRFEDESLAMIDIDLRGSGEN